MTDDTQTGRTDDGTDPLVVDGVTKRYGRVLALDGVSLQVDPGTIHCLLGPNGSGKTTLFDVVLGLTRPTSGTVDRGEATVGCGFQTATYYPDLTVGENVRTFAGVDGTVDAAWRELVLAELALDRVEDRTAGDLSGGWGKRLDLALAVLAQPEYVVLDEPLDDLDDVVRERVLAFLETYRAEVGGILVATHRATAFEGLADHVTVLHDGAVHLDAPTAALDAPLAAAYRDCID
jgi:ABC-2 type transport system ATP-binding protein